MVTRKQEIEFTPIKFNANLMQIIQCNLACYDITRLFISFHPSPTPNLIIAHNPDRGIPDTYEPEWAIDIYISEIKIV